MNVSKNDVKKSIVDIVGNAIRGTTTVTDRYHHNTSYGASPSIIRNGILTYYDLYKKGFLNISEKELEIASDIDSHVNGIDSVSFSVVGLTDLYKNELEFDPFSPFRVDFIVSSDIQASRSSTHYGNEFLSHGSVMNKDFRAVDVRIMECLDLLEKDKDADAEEMLCKYEKLRQIAIALRDTKLNIPLREMSNGDNVLDVGKVIEMPKLILK